VRLMLPSTDQLPQGVREAVGGPHASEPAPRGRDLWRECM
jgi:hypothetical protein